MFHLPFLVDENESMKLKFQIMGYVHLIFISFFPFSVSDRIDHCSVVLYTTKCVQPLLKF